MTSDTEIRDLSALKVGDQVVIVRNGSQHTIYAVSARTPTQIVIGTRRFRVEDGRLIGGADRWTVIALSLHPDDFRKARQNSAVRGLLTGYDYSQRGVMQMRAAATAAELALRENGEWEDGAAC